MYAEDRILEETLVDTGNKAGEYLVHTTPIQEARLQYILKQGGYESLQEYITEMLPILFRRLISGKQQAEYNALLNERMRQYGPELAEVLNKINGVQLEGE